MRPASFTVSCCLGNFKPRSKTSSSCQRHARSHVPTRPQGRSFLYISRPRSHARNDTRKRNSLKSRREYLSLRVFITAFLSRTAARTRLDRRAAFLPRLSERNRHHYISLCFNFIFRKHSYMKTAKILKLLINLE